VPAGAGNGRTPTRSQQPGRDARAHVELLLSRLAALGGTIEAEESLCGIRLAGEQFLERRLPASASAREALQGVIAIEYGALAVDDLEAGLQPVGDRLDDLRLGYPFADAQVARQQTEDEEGAGHCQQRQEAEHGKLACSASQ